MERNEILQERARLEESRQGAKPWKKWGPYLSERQWGTVREDYSPGGDAWNYFPHDQARSRAYRWGEDGLAGFSDDKQRLCFALSLWNGKDPIIKERAFGLTNSQGNHGEDVKEYYYYLDSTPTHSYMKYLYKYPQAAYPYDDLLWTNGMRSREDQEYELIDTGVFDENRYFDVFVEFAKQDAEDILIKVTCVNRGPEKAELDVIPTLWFRNTWSWNGSSVPKPSIRQLPAVASGWDQGGEAAQVSVAEAEHSELGSLYLYCDEAPALLFTENETNNERLFGVANAAPYTKDGINDRIVQGREEAVSPDATGTKVGAHHHLSLEPGEEKTLRLRLTGQGPREMGSAQEAGFPFGSDYEDSFDERLSEANQFYQTLTPAKSSPEEAAVLRQALGGMLWSKQYYGYDVEHWLEDHGASMLLGQTGQVRNRDWYHMDNSDVISMPDKWEYPWYAAWDLAFHALAFAVVDTDFAKEQLELMLSEVYLHPNGQIPAYEWNFSDVNPPVHAWASLFLYRIEKSLHGKGDIDFLKSVFNKLLLNFTWWVNRKDSEGNNVFEGGFLGLDNIGVFDRSAPLPTGGTLEQADGTAWMALFCQTMAEIAVEIAGEDPDYNDMAGKFLEHFLWIANAMNRQGDQGMWDEEDGFYYDLLVMPDGSKTRLKVRSMVGLLPMCATTVIEPWQRERVPGVNLKLARRITQIPGLRDSIHPTGPGHLGVGQRGIVALARPDQLRRILAKMLDENEFLSPHGIRSLSKFHQDHPYVFYANGQEFRVDYLPAESNTGMFGGNSNWRGPIWFPVNALLIRALMQFYLYYGDDFKVECPTGSGTMMNLFEVSREISHRLTSLFTPDAEGHRPVHGGNDKFQNDPHWKDLILFYEYFHGDNGAGIGASHQTGWTGTVATLIELFGRTDAGQFLQGGRESAFTRGEAGEQKGEERHAA